MSTARKVETSREYIYSIQRIFVFFFSFNSYNMPGEGRATRPGRSGLYQDQVHTCENGSSSDRAEITPASWELKRNAVSRSSSTETVSSLFHSSSSTQTVIENNSDELNQMSWKLNRLDEKDARYNSHKEFLEKCNTQRTESLHRANDRKLL